MVKGQYNMSVTALGRLRTTALLYGMKLFNTLKLLEFSPLTRSATHPSGYLSSPRWDILNLSTLIATHTR